MSLSWATVSADPEKVFKLNQRKNFAILEVDKTIARSIALALKTSTTKEKSSLVTASG